MGKRLSWAVVLVKPTSVQGNPTEVVLKNKVVSVAIRCSSNSQNVLWVGLNTDPNSKNYLEPGESMALGPYRDGDYVGDNTLSLCFENSDANNAAVVVITTEVNDNYC